MKISGLLTRMSTFLSKKKCGFTLGILVPKGHHAVETKEIPSIMHMLCLKIFQQEYK